MRRRRSHFLFLFLDGVGIGKGDPDINPFFSIDLPHFRKIFGGIPYTEHSVLDNGSSSVQPSDALLGVEGLPQSGTGQTSLFTGVNAARVIGAHFGPYPHSQIKPLLEEKNIFRVLKTLGADVHFANAFPKQFFEYVESGHRKLSVTTMSCMMTGIPLCNADSMRNGDGISADITAERWRSELGYSDIEPLSPFDAGKRLKSIAQKHDFTMFEYFLTDKAGHDRNKTLTEIVLKNFDELLGGVTSDGMENLTLLISSDHGNVEDLSVKTHTLNPSLTAVAGEHAGFFKGRLGSICDVTPRIVGLFTERFL
ncbi:MAG: metalloenzyme [Bacteroidetes bacterium]|nr:metalloenzyme [Bacteroidota bacterium]